jgi:hypothetical protein
VKKSAKTPRHELQQALDWQKRYREAEKYKQIEPI